MRNRILIAVTVVAACAVSAISSAQGPNSGHPISSADILVSLGGDVTATIAPYGFGGSPGYTNQLFFVPASSAGLATDTYIGSNRQFTGTPASADLGTIGAGSEVKIGMGANYNGNGLTTLSNYDNFWLTGPGSRNADGQIHAYMQTLSPGTVEINFEDEPNAFADWNYGDASVIVTGVQVTPEPASYAVLAVGALGLIRRRNKR